MIDGFGRCTQPQDGLWWSDVLIKHDMCGRYEVWGQLQYTLEHHLNQVPGKLLRIAWRYIRTYTTAEMFKNMHRCCLIPEGSVYEPISVNSNIADSDGVQA